MVYSFGDAVGADADVQLLVFARTWCALIAQGDWNGALSMLDERGPNASAHHFQSSHTANRLITNVPPRCGIADFAPALLNREVITASPMVIIGINGTKYFRAPGS